VNFLTLLRLYYIKGITTSRDSHRWKYRMAMHQNSEKERNKLLQAGKIAAQALTYTCKLVKHNNSLLDIANAGENYIRESGGQPAFPINISINHHAAHYSPTIDDSQQIPNRALVKIDLGVHIDGYIADNARTVIVGGDARMQKLKDAADAGLQAAISTIKAGIRVWDVSMAISAAMRTMGVRPIENLTGHSIERYVLHAGISIPSVVHRADRVISPRLKEHMVIAIEPFATYSRNPQVVGLERGGIFGFSQLQNPTTQKLRQLFSQMKMTYAQLPFASRWLEKLVSPAEINNTLSMLEQEGCIHNYPVLGLTDKNYIAQSEYTIIVEKNGCTITTQSQ
jgi:methionyl aminopeptidase